MSVGMCVCVGGRCINRVLIVCSFVRVYCVHVITPKVVKRFLRNSVNGQLRKKERQERLLGVNQIRIGIED